MVLARMERNLSGQMLNVEQFFQQTGLQSGSLSETDINEKWEKWKLHPGEKENTSRLNAHVVLLFLPSSVVGQDAAHSQPLKQLNYSIYTVPSRKPNPIKSCLLI